MQGETKYAPIRFGAMQAFMKGGTKILKHPKRLVGVVLDFVDPDAPQTNAFAKNCDGDFLSVYTGAVQKRSQRAIEEAALKAELVLRNDRQLRDDTARQIACELAFALANYLRVGCPERVRSVAVGHATSHSQQRQTASAVGGGNSGVVELGSSSVQNGRVLTRRPEPRSPHGRSVGNQTNTSTSTNATTSTSTSTNIDTSTNTRGGNVFGGATTSGGVNAAVLSDDPSVREGQIERTGTGMAWFRVLKAVCMFAGVTRLFQIFYYMSLAGGASASTQLEFKTFMYIVAFGMVLLCIAYFCSYLNLRGFKKNATNDFCFVRAVDLLALGLTFFVFFDMASKSVAIYIEFQELIIIYLIIHLIISLSAIVYLEKRKQFFTL